MTIIKKYRFYFTDKLIWIDMICIVNTKHRRWNLHSYNIVIEYLEILLINFPLKNKRKLSAFHYYIPWLSLIEYDLQSKVVFGRYIIVAPKYQVTRDMSVCGAPRGTLFNL